MRKIFVCVMAAMMVFTAAVTHAAEVPANPFSGFGLYTSYVTSGSVKLNAVGLPDYSEVKSFRGDGVTLGGTLKPGADTSSLPVGTVTILSGDNAGKRYRFTPGGSSRGSSFVGYNADYSYYDSYGNYHSGELPAGSRVMWNLYTSPDVVAGAADIKSASDIDPVSIGRNDIVPFVKSTQTSSYTYRYDVYFVKSGDWGVPVAVDYDSVAVNGYVVPDFSNPYPVRHTIGRSYYYDTTIAVTCTKGRASYTWNFELTSSLIEWGKLSLDLQPFTLKAGESQTVTVKLPSRYDLREAYASADITDRYLEVGDASVLEAGNITFTQGAGWHGDNEEKSTLEFVLTGLEPGRSALGIYIPRIGTYYREIHVTDENGSMNIAGGTTSLYPIITHTTRARYVEGRPYYPSAEDYEARLTGFGGFTGATLAVSTSTSSSGDVKEYSYYTGPHGYLGTVRDSRRTISELTVDGETGKSYNVSSYSGVRYTTLSTDSYYNSEYPGDISFSLDASEDIEIWLEFPASYDMNLSSAKLSSLVSLDKIRSTSVQLEDFAPYFQLHHASNDLDVITSVDWSFVKPATMEKVTPSGLTDITIGGHTVTGTSGTVAADGYFYPRISYTYNGTVYEWEFSRMNSTNYTTSAVLVGTGKTVSVDLPITIDSGQIYIFDSDILSADPTAFTSADFQSRTDEAVTTVILSQPVINTSAQKSAVIHTFSQAQQTVTGALTSEALQAVDGYTPALAAVWSAKASQVDEAITSALTGIAFNAAARSQFFPRLDTAGVIFPRDNSTLKSGTSSVSSGASTAEKLAAATSQLNGMGQALSATEAVVPAEYGLYVFPMTFGSELYGVRIAGAIGNRSDKSNNFADGTSIAFVNSSGDIIDTIPDASLSQDIMPGFVGVLTVLEAGKTYEPTVYAANDSLAAAGITLTEAVTAEVNLIETLTSDSTVSFRVKGIKDGLSSLSLIHPYSESSSPYYRYSAYRWNVTVGEVSEDITPATATATFSMNANYAPMIEGRPYYGGSSVSFPDYVSIRLDTGLELSESEYEAKRDDLTGIMYVSGDKDTQVTLYPYANYSRYDNGTYYRTVYYDVSSTYFTSGKTVRWEFSSGLIKSGSATIPTFDSRKAADTIPSLTLNRDGINAETLEWSFTDSKDNPVTAPSNVRVWVNNYQREISSDKGTGNISVNLPEAFINNIDISYEQDGLTYTWNFRPVDSPSYSWNGDIFTWNAASNDLPLAMKKGETREVLLSVSDDYGNITPLIGNPGIVSMSVVSSTDSTVTVRLTAKEAGMTTLGMRYQRKETYTVYPTIPDNSGSYPVAAVYGGDVATVSSVSLDDSDVIDIVLNPDGSATAGGAEVPTYNYVWHADPQHPAEYWTDGMTGTEELDSDAYEAAITSTNNGLYIARDIRYTPNTLDFTTSQTAQKDEDTEYVVYYDSSSPAVAAAIAALGETYGTAYSTDRYIFATLPMSNGGMPGGDFPGGNPQSGDIPDFPGGMPSSGDIPDFPGGMPGSGDTPPDFPGGNMPSGDVPGTPGAGDTRLPVMTTAASDSESIAAMSTMTHSAEDAYNNPVLHITEPGTYRISGTWHGQIWVETGAKAKHKVNIILNGVDVSCDVAPAIVFYKVYKWAEDNGYDDQSTLTANNLWRNIGGEMVSADGSYNVGAVVEIADGTTNTFTGSNVYRLLELCPKLDDDDNPKYTGSGIGTDISEQEKMYKLDGAFHSRRTMVIGGNGTLNITSTTCEGLDSEMHMLVDGGNISVTAPDDGINVNEDYVSVFQMDSGTLTVSSTNADGIDSNGWIAFNGGTLNISAGNQSQNSAGEAGLDAENEVYIYDSSAYNWTSAGGSFPSTPDVPTPTSPDIPTPTPESPDVPSPTPTSPDIPTPISPDVPATPETRVTYYGDYIAWPREIWVSELDSSTGKYRVPHLTDDIDALMDTLKPGGSDWTEYSTASGDKSATASDEPEYDQSAKDVGYQGLSVYPRFAMPQDPSADAYKAVWEFSDAMNTPYGVSMFSSENMTVTASRDAVEVWQAMKDELLSKDIPQLVAIVLPEMDIEDDGFYVFRLPADNITGSNQAVFWRAERSGDVDYERYEYYYGLTSADLDTMIFLDDGGNLTGAVSGDDYINVAAYFTSGVYRPVITAAATSRDLEILSGIPSPISPDTRPISPDIIPTSPDTRPVSPDIRPTSPDTRPTSPDINPTSPDVRPTSPDVTPTSPDVAPVSARTTRPSINVQETASALRTILGRSDAAVTELPATSTGTARTVSDLSANQLTAISAQGREAAAVLPEITVETAAIYVFGVSLDNLAPGAAIFLDMTTTPINAGSLEASENYTGDYTFLDDSGNEVYTVPANRHVNVAAYLEPDYVYSPVITTSSSGTPSVVGSSSGGCSSVYGGLLLAGLALVIRRKR